MRRYSTAACHGNNMMLCKIYVHMHWPQLRNLKQFEPDSLSVFHGMEGSSSIGNALDFRIPSALNLMMYLHWHHLKEIDEDREQAANRCCLTQHHFENSIQKCMITGESQDPLPVLQMGNELTKVMLAKPCIVDKCADCYKGNGNVSFWHKGPWICEKVESALNGNSTAIADSASLKALWLDCLEKVPDARCRSCKLVKHKTDIFEASQKAYTWWDHQNYETKSSSMWSK